MSDTSLGERIRHEVDRRGITYKEAAAEVGVNVNALRRIAQGSYSPTETTLGELKRWLEVEGDLLRARLTRQEYRAIQKYRNEA